MPGKTVVHVDVVLGQVLLEAGQAAFRWLNAMFPTVDTTPPIIILLPAYVMKHNKSVLLMQTRSSSLVLLLFNE